MYKRCLSREWNRSSSRVGYPFLSEIVDQVLEGEGERGSHNPICSSPLLGTSQLSPIRNFPFCCEEVDLGVMDGGRFVDVDRMLTILKSIFPQVSY